MKKTNRFLGLLTACTLILGMTAGTYQAAVYDQSGEWGPALSGDADPASQRIYPGDSIANTDIYIDSEAVESNDTLDDGATGCWTNYSGTVYTAAISSETVAAEAADAPELAFPAMDESGLPVQALDPDTQEPLTDMNGLEIYQDEAGNLVYQDGMGGYTYDPNAAPAEPVEETVITSCTLSVQGGTLEAVDASFTGEGLNRDYQPAALDDGMIYSYTDENGNPVQVYDRSNLDSAAYAVGETASLTANDKTAEGLAFQYWMVYTVDSGNTLNAVAVEMLADEDLGSLNADLLKQPSVSVPVTDFDSRIVFRPVYAASQEPETAAPTGETDPVTQLPADPTQTQGGETAETDPVTQLPADPTQTQGSETVETDPTTQLPADPTQTQGSETAETDPTTQLPADPTQTQGSETVETDPVTQLPADQTQTQGGETAETDPATQNLANPEDISIFDNTDNDAIKVLTDTDEYGVPQQAAQEQTGLLTLVDAVSDPEDPASITAGAMVTVTAAEKENMDFAGWTPVGITLDETQLTQNPLSFTMPETQVTLTANYKVKETEPEQYAVNVKDASVDNTELVDNGDGTKTAWFAAGQQITVTAADKTAENQAFANWSAEGVTLEEAQLTQNPLVLAMPAAQVKLTANYTAIETEPPVETITVESATIQDVESVDNGDGTKSAAVEEGTKVTVVADPAPEGQAFDRWELSAQGEVETSSLTEQSLEVTVGSSPVTAVAVYTAAAPVITVTATQPTGGTIAVAGEATAAADKTVSIGDTCSYTLTPAAGYQIDSFTARIGETDVTGLQLSEDKMTLTFTVPDTITADTTITVSAALTQVFTLTVTNGSGGGTCTAGSTPTITANTAQTGYRFTKWTLTSGEGTFASDTSATTTFTMGASDATVTANYEQIPYTLTVNSGKGGGTHYNGEQVVITADTPESGYRFHSWTLTSGNGTIATTTASQTTFTMTTSDATVTANYELIPYSLKVKQGSGSGSYTKGTEVDITPNFPSSGKEFDYWEKTSGKISIDDKHLYYATVTMKASDATVTAIYKDGPNPNNNTITGLENGAEYLKSTTLSFTAAGAGMDNTDPNPGDYRYRPSSYQIGSVGGSWSSSPYTTSMAINATGDYTLTVTYAKDVYDGNTWTADGTTVNKSITFHVVNALSVQTGDNSPLIPLAIAGGVALAVIIVLLIVLKKRKKR